MVFIIYGYITNSKRDQAFGLLAFNSSIGRTLHRYREGHAFYSCSSLDVFFFPRLWFQICLSAHNIKIFIFPSDPTFHAMNICEKKFDLDKKRFCYKCFKTWKSYFLAVDPCRWSQHRHAQSCDVDSGLTYLARFTSVNLASRSVQNASFQYVVWAIKLNLQR